MSRALLHLIATRAPLVTLVSAALLVAAFAIGSTVIPHMEAGSAQFADLSSESRLANLEVERSTGVEADPGVLALVTGGPAVVARDAGADRSSTPRSPARRSTSNGVVLAFLHTRGGDSSKQAADRLLAAFADDPQRAPRRRRDRRRAR